MTEQPDLPRQRKTRRGRWEAEKAPDMPRLLVSKKEAAGALSLCLRTVDSLIATKQLPQRGNWLSMTAGSAFLRR
jgi:hypothetical protein